jgi:hypothetical protein
LLCKVLFIFFFFFRRRFTHGWLSAIGTIFYRTASTKSEPTMIACIYLQEKGLDDYSVLKEKASAASARFNELSERIKTLETGLSDNANLQKQIVTYSKTRNTYVEYRKAGYSKKFRELHEADIILHQAAKKAFDDLGYGEGKRLPTVASLRAEYAPMLDDAVKALGEEGFSAIAGALDMFRKK